MLRHLAGFSGAEVELTMQLTLCLLTFGLIHDCKLSYFSVSLLANILFSVYYHNLIAHLVSPWLGLFIIPGVLSLLNNNWSTITLNLLWG